MLASRQCDEPKEFQPIPACGTKFVTTQRGLLKRFQRFEVLVANFGPLWKPEERGVERAEIDVAEIAQRQAKWREDHVLAVRMLATAKVL